MQGPECKFLNVNTSFLLSSEIGGIGDDDPLTFQWPVDLKKR